MQIRKHYQKQNALMRSRIILCSLGLNVHSSSTYETCSLLIYARSDELLLYNCAYETFFRMIFVGHLLKMSALLFLQHCDVYAYSIYCELLCLFNLPWITPVVHLIYYELLALLTQSKVDYSHCLFNFLWITLIVYLIYRGLHSLFI